MTTGQRHGERGARHGDQLEQPHIPGRRGGNPAHAGRDPAAGDGDESSGLKSLVPGG